MNVNVSTDTDVTRKVKADYNQLTEQEFLNKYSVRKSVYRKRVEKYGDPYARRTGKAKRR